MATTPISSSESTKKSNISNSFKQFINCLNGSFNINIGKVIMIFLVVYFILNSYL